MCTLRYRTKSASTDVCMLWTNEGALLKDKEFYARYQSGTLEIAQTDTKTTAVREVFKMEQVVQHFLAVSFTSTSFANIKHSIKIGE